MTSGVGLAELAMLLGLSVTRLAAAFLMLPMFTQDSLPAMVRNSLFVGLAVITLAMQPIVPLGHLDLRGWLVLFGKEALIGVTIGFLSSGLLWAIESAGHMIDTKAGTTMAQIVDPLTGHQTSLTGLFMGRLAGFVFMFSGGFLFMVGALIESYALWPIAAPLPPIRPGAVSLLEGEFARIMLLALAFAAPALVVLFVVDAALGLINRYAQQLNVFMLAAPLKAVLGTAVVLLMLGTIVDALVGEFAGRHVEVLRTVRALLGS
jgi:type III secretion protein T